MWSSPDTQVAVVAKDKLVVTTDRTALKLVPPTEAPDGTRIFLGIDREAGAGQTADRASRTSRTPGCARSAGSWTTGRPG